VVVVAAVVLSLQIASILCFIMYGLAGDVNNLTIAIFLMVAVLITSVMAYLQEGQSAKIMNSFKV